MSQYLRQIYNKTLSDKATLVKIVFVPFSRVLSSVSTPIKSGSSICLNRTRWIAFLCSPKGEHKFAALSIRLSIRLLHFCLEHISKSIEGNLMKLDTPIEGHEGNCRMQEP